MNRRISPALAHQQRILARQATARAVAEAEAGAASVAAARPSLGLGGEGRGNQDGPEAEAYARLQLQLRGDVQSLKQIQSLERKIDYKRQVLPTYDAWVDGVLAAGREAGKAPQDEVFATLMIWHIDAGLYHRAVAMAAHVLTHGLALPDRIDRTPACFIVEEIAEAAIRAYSRATDEAPADFDAAVLGELELLVECLPPEATDMPDEVRAKLERALGLALLAQAKDTDLRIHQAAALKHYQRALELDERVGVKKDIERLNRDLKKGGEPPAGEGGDGDQADRDGQASPDDQADDETPPSGEGGGQDQTDTRSSGEEPPAQE